MAVRNLKLFAGGLSICAGLVSTSIGDAWDPGDDTSSGATQLSPPTLEIQTTGTHFLSSSDTEDWFKVSLTAGATYLFEATGSTDTEGFLYSDPGGSTVAYNFDNGELANFLIVYTPNSSGTYYLKVKEWFEGDAEYVLSYKVVLDAWDPADDTGVGATHRQMDEFAHVEGPHTLTDTDTDDWYRFTLTDGNTYRFETTGNWNTYGQLFSDSAGSSEVAAADNGGDYLNCRIDHTPSVSGDFYLKISQISAMENEEDYAEYNLEYMLIEDQWDPMDDTVSGASVLSPIDETLRIRGPHALNNTDEYDWFKIHLIAGNMYHFESTGGSDTEGYLYSDPSGSTVVADNDDFQPEVDSNFRIIYEPESTGNYYLRVTHSQVGNEAIYQLKYVLDNDSDLDGDGMPDSWENLYFIIEGTNAQPDADNDSDTQYNIEEYIAGTDPTNPASFFAVSNWSTGSFIVGWPSVAGRQYRVHWANSLTNEFHPLDPVVEHPQNSYTDTIHSAEESGFYKVEVQLK